MDVTAVSGFWVGSGIINCVELGYIKVVINITKN
jgi:hypothetical protein